MKFFILFLILIPFLYFNKCKKKYLKRGESKFHEVYQQLTMNFIFFKWSCDWEWFIFLRASFNFFVSTSFSDFPSFFSFLPLYIIFYTYITLCDTGAGENCCVWERKMYSIHVIRCLILINMILFLTTQLFDIFYYLKIFSSFLHYIILY